MNMIQEICKDDYSSFSFARRIQNEIFSFHEYGSNDLFLEVKYRSYLHFFVTFSPNHSETVVSFQFYNFPTIFLKSFVFGKDGRWLEFIHKNHDRAVCLLSDFELTDLIKKVFLYLYSMGYIDQKPSFMDKKLFFSLPYKVLSSYSKDAVLLHNLLQLDELSSDIDRVSEDKLSYCSYILYMIKGCNDEKYEVLVYLLYDANYRVLNNLCRILITQQSTGEIICFLTLNVQNDKCLDTLLVSSLYDNIPYRITDIAMMSLFYVIRDCGFEELALIEEPKISNYNSFVYTRVMKDHQEYGYILSFMEKDESNYYFFALTDKDFENDTRFETLLQDIDQLEKHRFMKYDHNKGEIELSPLNDKWFNKYQEFVINYFLGRLHLERNINKSFKLLELELKSSMSKKSFVEI